MHDAQSGALAGFAMISDNIPQPMDDDLVGPYYVWKLLIDGFNDTGQVMWRENVLALDLAPRR